MGARILLIVASVALLIPTVAASESTTGSNDLPVVADTLDCAPPCGYILPILDIQVDDKQSCGGGRLIYSEGPPEDCDVLLAPGESRSYDARLLWYWEVSEDGTYPKNTNEDIIIEFSGTATNPRWLKVAVDGEGTVDGQYRITDVDLLDPQNYQIRDDDQSLWFWFERDITITFTRDGDPNQSDLDRIKNREGIQVFFLKGKSTDSDPRFKEAFGVEEFRFNACNDEAVAAQVDGCPGLLQPDGTYLQLSRDEKASAPAVVAVLGALGVALLARRRAG